MIPGPHDGSERLAALHYYRLLGTQADDEFDLQTELAAELSSTSYCFVSLVGEDCVWFKSRYIGRAHGHPGRHQFRPALPHV